MSRVASAGNHGVSAVGGPARSGHGEPGCDTPSISPALCCPQQRYGPAHERSAGAPTRGVRDAAHTPGSPPRRRLGAGTTQADACGRSTRPGRLGHTDSTRYATFGAIPRTGPPPRSFVRHAPRPARHGSAARQRTSPPEPIPTPHHHPHQTAIGKPIRPNVKHQVKPQRQGSGGTTQRTTHIAREDFLYGFKPGRHGPDAPPLAPASARSRFAPRARRAAGARHGRPGRNLQWLLWDREARIVRSRPQRQAR